VYLLVSLGHAGIGRVSFEAWARRPSVFSALSQVTSTLAPDRYRKYAKSLTDPPLQNVVTAALLERSTGRVIFAPPAAELSDLQHLVSAACDGDDAAWEALYRSIYPRLRAYFVRRVGAEHADDGVSETMTRAVASIHRFQWSDRVGAEHADDGVSETMTRAVASIHRFQWSDAGFDGWVFGIARHVSVDHHRRLERVRRYRHIGRLFPGAKSDGTEPVDHDLIIGDDQALIRRLFVRLSPAEQEVLELRVIAGLSAEQVGEVLGRRPGAVRTAQSRALAHLRELMEEHDG
jgi:RNA polymerase sigma-70 factor (ECF subfamily)